MDSKKNTGFIFFLALILPLLNLAARFLKGVQKIMAYNISFGRSKEVWQNYELLIRGLIDSHNLTKICDIGGGANPLLPLDFVLSRNLDYAVIDISEEELNKAYDGYKKIAQDITTKDFNLSEKFGLVYSKMLAEHVKDGMLLHKNIFAILDDGGIAVHFFPTLYAFPFLVNKLMPEKLSNILLNLLAPRDSFQRAKFPSYYSWCRGPTRKMLIRFAEIGYEIIEYKGLYGHEGYYRKLPVIRTLHKYTSEFLLKHPNSYLTSYAYVILRKTNDREKALWADKP